MAEQRGIVRRVVAVFDRAAARKMEGEFEDSLQKAGERGGKKAGASTMTELKRELDKRKAELARDLAAGVISEKEWKKQTDAATRTFNAGVLRLMDEAKAKGAAGEREFNKLARALRRVGDQGQSAFDRIKRGIMAAGGALAAFFGARAIARSIGDSIRAFEALRTGQRQLEQQLANTGIAWSEVSAEVREHARALWDTHRLTQGEVNQTLRQLILVTGDYRKSLSLVGLAHDLMAATGLGAEQATRLLGRAMNGELGALNRYGIQLDQNRDVVEQLTERLNGQARAAASNAVTWQKAIGDLKETIGGLITAAFGMDEGFSAAAEAVRKLNDALSANADEWSRLGRFTVSVTRTIVNSFWIVTQAVGSGVSAVIGGILAVINTVPNSLNWLIRQVNRIPGVNIDVTLGTLPADKFFAEMRAANERVENSVSAIADAWRKVDNEAGKAGATVRALTDSGEDTPGGGGGPAAAGRDREAEALERLQAQQDAYVAGLVREIDVHGRRAAAVLEGEEAVEALNRQLHIENALLAAGAEVGTEFAETIEHLAAAQYDAARAAELAAQSVQSNWTQAAEAVREELAGLGDSASGIFGMIANSGIAGLARLAKAKIVENLAWAIENVAKALGSLNPAASSKFSAAAAKHTAAAAKWGAVGAVAGAIGGGGAGGGAVGGAAAPNTGIAQRSERPGPEITIFIDPLDPQNPAYQRNVYATEQYARQRYGENARINIRRRST